MKCLVEKPGVIVQKLGNRQLGNESGNKKKRYINFSVFKYCCPNIGLECFHNEDAERQMGNLLSPVYLRHGWFLKLSRPEAPAPKGSVQVSPVDHYSFSNLSTLRVV